jgi:hypothetical protein
MTFQDENLDSFTAFDPNRTSERLWTELIYWPFKPSGATIPFLHNLSRSDCIPQELQIHSASSLGTSQLCHQSRNFLVGWNDNDAMNLRNETIVLGMYHHTSFESVCKELDKLRAKYSCEMNGSFGPRHKNESIDKDNSVANECGCFSCICIQRLKVVATLKISSSCSKINIQDFQLYVGKQDTIPTFYVQPNHLDHNISEDNPSLFTPCIIFYPILPYVADRPRLSLGHYRTDLMNVIIRNRVLDMSSHHNDHIPQSAFDLFDYSVLYTKNSDDRWRLFLLRISEVCSIVHELKNVIQEEKRNDTKIAGIDRLNKEIGSNDLSPNPCSSDSFNGPFTTLHKYSLVSHIICTRMRCRPFYSEIVLSATRKMACFPVQNLFPLFTALRQYVHQSQPPPFKNHGYLPREVKSILFHHFDNEFLFKLCDGLMGLFFGCLLLHFSIEFISSASHLWTLVNRHLLRDNISWLESYPIGFKLNPPLTSFFGRAILYILDYYDFVLKCLVEPWNDGRCVHVLGFFSVFFGFNFACALLFDGARILTLHIYMLYTFFQFCYRYELILISSLTNFFRGRKKNILRQRFDTMQSDYMQLIVMMIIFAICLFLYTTILVYYVFFCVVYLLANSLLPVVSVAMVSFNVFPFGHVMARGLTGPDRFLDSVYFLKVWHDRMNENRSCALFATPIRVSTIIYSPMSRYIVCFVRLIPHHLSEVLLGKRLSLTANLLSICESSLIENQIQEK